MELKLQNVSKSYQNNIVLDHFSMSLSNSEIVVLKGPSGVGKTTVLRCISSLETIDSGHIILNDVDISKAKNNRKVSVSSMIKKLLYSKAEQFAFSGIQQKIGYVFQNYNLFPHMTVLENVVEAPIYHKIMTKDEAMKQAKTLLKELGIDDKEESYPCELSGGQRQRVAIARACMLRPEVLCFDEPTAALDPQSTMMVADLVKELAAKGLGIIIVTHDESFASVVATRSISLT